MQDTFNENIKLMVESLIRQGLVENVDFRVVYFGTSYEIKMITI